MEDATQQPEYVPVPPAAPVATAGLADNVAGALAYVTIIPAIIFLVMEPYNKRPFIRFHAFQSLGLGVLWFITGAVMIVPILGWIIGFVGFLVLFCAWVLCIVKAYGGVKFKLPVLGDFVENMANQS
jgi:uncharacterized membrane protein